MGKQGRSSATSATRKKHAKKAAAHDPSIAIAPAAKAQGKGKGKKNKEPKIKQYIPPPKYKPLVEDPIESLSIASVLPPAMVLCFKGLSKKDPVTKTKALEELSGMLDEESWTAALPVWLWHFVPLSVHPSRRLRELGATFHSKLLDQPNIRDELQTYILSDATAGTFLAAWALGANDTVSTAAAPLKTSWTSNIAWLSNSPEGQLIEIQDHVDDMIANIVQAIVDPDQLYRQFAPLLARSTKDGDSSDAVDGEHAQDLNARIRTAGLNTLAWILEGSPAIVLPSLLPILGQLLSSNSLLGTVLYSPAQAPFIARPISTGESTADSSWGHGQRGVRMAGWNLVKLLVKYFQQDNTVQPADDVDKETETQPELKSSFLSNLGVAALRSAWVETDAGVRSSMWEGFLPLITAFPEVWDTDPLASLNEAGGDDAAESEDEEDDAIETTSDRATTSAPTTSPGQLAFEEFLHFLEIGCHGSAIQSYPATVIVLSTLPPTIFPYDQGSLDRFFASFWAAYDGKALNVLPRDREQTFKAFLSSLLDCIVFISRKLQTLSLQPQPSGSSPANQQDSNLSVVPVNWMANVLAELVEGDLCENLSQGAAGALIGGSMRKLELLDPVMTEQAWASTWEPVFFRQSRLHRTNYVIKLLAAMSSATPDGINGKRIDLVLQRKSRVDSAEAENLDPLLEQAQVLVSLWQCLEVSRVPWLAEVTHDVLTTELMKRLIASGDSRGVVDILNGFLNSPTSSVITRQTTWTQFTDAAIQTSGFEVLRKVLESIQVTFPTFNEDSALYAVCKSWVTHALQGHTERLQDIIAILVHWDVCLSESRALEILELVVSGFITATRELLFGPGDTSESSTLETLARILSGILAHEKSQRFWNWTNLDFTQLGACLLTLSALPDLSPSLSRCSTQCKQAWKLWSLYAPSELQPLVTARTKNLIGSLLISCATILSAPDVLTIASQSALYVDERMILLEAVPSHSKLDLDLDELKDNPSLVLAEADPLISLDEREPSSVALSAYDSQGFSKYVRLGSALARILSEERHLAKENLWTFRHLLALQQICSDFVSASFWPSDAIRQGSTDNARLLLDIVVPIVIYLGNSLFSDLSLEWHKQTISRLQNSGSHCVSPQDAQDIVYQAYSNGSLRPSSTRNGRPLRRVMQFVLRDAESDALELWSGFAQAAYAQHPNAAEAIGSVLAARGIESPRLDRWRNEIASRIPGVSMSAINKTGLPLLQTLHCLAPPPESGIIFMPQQRGVFLIQALQKWMSSDEDLDSSVELRITITVNHLLPILQTVPGAHWEFIFDILENNLGVEGSSANLYLLLQTLRAIATIQELAETNRALREIWKPRQHDLFQGVLQMFLDTSDSKEVSETRDKFYACLADVIQTLPSEQIQADQFDRLLSLTSSHSVPIKAAAHYLARNALAQITEQRVLEAAVNIPSETDGEGEPPADKSFELPQTLIEKLFMPSSDVAGLAERYVDLLLSWWIALEFFDNSSVKLKQGYIDQLRKLNLVKNSLLPCLFGLLKIGVVGEKPFNLVPWSVEEFYLNLYDNSLPFVSSILAAHIYFKALKSVPGLIRTWYSECQDRQLTTSLSSYTKSHFSPVLIKQELDQFRSSAAAATEALADDNFTLKVAPSVSEISASYAVDEQEAFEVSIRLPSEFPLRPAEVKDVRGVAGMENRRRAWVFGVQHAAQQGLLYDALVMYKKNVAGHFEGKSECAICYSLISVTDRTLPTKPCRTCKNLFHASCLYKWFNTSHSSTCPLCRSEIL